MSDRARRALRLLVAGRVTVDHADDTTVRARVKGTSTAIRHVAWIAGDGWDCTCPARHHCSHLTAVQLIVDHDTADATVRAAAFLEEATRP